jgi:hypothetical protein
MDQANSNFQGRWCWQHMTMMIAYSSSDTKSLERCRKLPVRLRAEQAVNVPLKPLQGSGDLVKRDIKSQASIQSVFSTCLDYLQFLLTHVQRLSMRNSVSLHQDCRLDLN